jgi:hypothetical protein
MGGYERYSQYREGAWRDYHTAQDEVRRERRALTENYAFLAEKYARLSEEYDALQERCQRLFDALAEHIGRDAAERVMAGEPGD